MASVLKSTRRLKICEIVDLWDNYLWRINDRWTVEVGQIDPVRYLIIPSDEHSRNEFIDKEFQKVGEHAGYVVFIPDSEKERVCKQ